MTGVPDTPFAALAPGHHDPFPNTRLHLKRVAGQFVGKSFLGTLAFAEYAGVKLCKAMLAVEEHRRPLVVERRFLVVCVVHRRWHPAFGAPLILPMFDDWADPKLTGLPHDEVAA